MVYLATQAAIQSVINRRFRASFKSVLTADLEVPAIKELPALDVDVAMQYREPTVSPPRHGLPTPARRHPILQYQDALLGVSIFDRI